MTRQKLQPAVSTLRGQAVVDESLLPQSMSLGWDHIQLTGDDSWQADKRMAKGRIRPLRDSDISQSSVLDVQK